MAKDMFPEDRAAARAGASVGAIPSPEETARRARLRHVGDEDPGLARRRRGRGFSYHDPDGARVAEAETLARIRALAIPPAWTEVWICPDPDGHIQATGRDARGRKQYRYHPRWTDARALAKFDALPAFAEALPAMRARIEADMRRRALGREKVLASVCWLLDHALVRIGNPDYARENASFGLTTLRARHLRLDGDELRLRFMGKSGREWDLRLTDRRVQRVARACHELPGQRLFRWVEEGGTHPVGSQDVNDYLREISGRDITSRHFRTWAATVQAAAALAQTPPPGSKAEMQRRVNAAIDQVAKRLGNTRAVCRSGYVHPLVPERYAEGVLAQELSRGGPRREGLDQAEARTLAWLNREARARR